MQFKDCIEVPFQGSDLYEWFINQDHIPFDMSSDAHGMHYTLYQNFLKEIEDKFFETYDNHYWFTKDGRLVSDEGSRTISSNSITVNKSKVRDLKIDRILRSK